MVSTWGHISYGQSKIQCEKLSSALTHKPVTDELYAWFICSAKVSNFCFSVANLT